MRTAAEPKASAPTPAPTTSANDVPPPTAAPPAMTSASPVPAGGAGKPGAPTTAQPAGSRFRASEGPSMAPRGTPSMSRRLDRTP